MSNFLKRTGIKQNTLRGVILTTVFFILAAILLGIWHADEMRRIVSQQFNDEQLVIARNVATLLERELGFLQTELALISRDIAATPYEPDMLQAGMQKSLHRVVASGVRQIQVINLDRDQGWQFILHGPWRSISLDDASRNLLPVYDDLPNRHRPDVRSPVWISRPMVSPAQITLLMATALPAPHRGLVMFDINVAWFLNPLVKEIRSGRTGYAWIICDQGFFLYHPKTEFIGHDAFNIRQEEDPRRSFHTINFIQQEKMLKGQEGQGSYESGWHRGFVGHVKKLIAYTPVRVAQTPPQKWSIAVVAPVSEIEDVVRQAYNRQLALQILILTVIVLSAGTVLLFERRWSRFLEAKVAERTEELQRSKEKYQSLIESAEDFIFTVNRRNCFLSMNTYMARFFGGHPNDFLYQSLRDLLPFEASDAAQESPQRSLESCIEQVFNTRRSTRDIFEVKLPSRALWLSANFMPLKDQRHQVTAVLCIARDITENRMLEDQLRNAEKLASLGTLAAGVAHEINNPLGVMLGFCDLLVRQAEDGTQTWEDLKTIERHGLHCKEIVENLLSFARVSPASSQNTHLNACIREVLKVVYHTLEMNDIELKTALEDNLPPVRGDFRQLQQVFLNLINNAVAAMTDGPPESGSVLTIQTRHDSRSRQVVVEVRDTGSGISREAREHIFEPFYTTKPEGQGTGLGLFVSYGIIHRHGGTIECVSPPADTFRSGSQETVFRISLPIAEES